MMVDVIEGNELHVESDSVLSEPLTSRPSPWEMLRCQTGAGLEMQRKPRRAEISLLSNMLSNPEGIDDVSRADSELAIGFSKWLARGTHAYTRLSACGMITSALRDTETERWREERFPPAVRSL